MNDPQVESFLKPYGDARVLIPMVAMFIIVFAIVRRTIKDIDLFQGSAGVLVAICVSLLAMYGVDQTLVRVIVVNYTAMGMAMLMSLALLLLVVWLRIVRKGLSRK